MLRLLLILLMGCLPLSSAQALILVQVSNVSDLTLPNWSLGDPAVKARIDLCVYSTLTADYGVQVSQAGGFKLTGTGGSIPYTLSWDDGGTGNLGVSSSPLTNNVKLNNRRRANLVSPICLGGNNARLNVEITQADMQAALAGSYNATINIVVSTI